MSQIAWKRSYCCSSDRKQACFLPGPSLDAHLSSPTRERWVLKFTWGSPRLISLSSAWRFTWSLPTLFSALQPTRGSDPCCGKHHNLKYVSTGDASIFRVNSHLRALRSAASVGSNFDVSRQIFLFLGWRFTWSLPRPTAFSAFHLYSGE